MFVSEDGEHEGDIGILLKDDAVDSVLLRTGAQTEVLARFVSCCSTVQEEGN